MSNPSRKNDRNNRGSRPRRTLSPVPERPPTPPRERPPTPIPEPIQDPSGLTNQRVYVPGHPYNCDCQMCMIASRTPHQ